MLPTPSAQTTTPGPQTTAIQKILVALDYRTEDPSIFAQALNFAEKFQAALTIFHCVQPQPVAMPEIGSLAAYGGMIDSTAIALQEEQFQQHLTNVDHWLQSLAHQARHKKIPTTIHQQIGDPSETICAIAKNQQADLIILGRRGLTGLGEVFLGSVSSYVLHHAPCSVLVVQHPQTPEKSPKHRK
ncbi:universal stress protein [Picosynechococcus sp. PCC 73109]|uniref:universal stress protein n=1 Tax=Picosynechococcus sp. PCC 73109 TaxID=374982 RepID=UPI0007457DD1|nr:universal stress protein [Picosynechococcus sp. PCC 73109]AMA10236.1 universal stress protein [Picosynechococcus sp. PCC 73109]